MGCVPANLCKRALADATASFPTRSRGSDGICGDASHQARKSDHNMGNAFDLTHDPKSGCDAHGFAEQVKNQKPGWVKYIISKGRIWNPSVSPNWRTYTGSNPHNAHAHFSINASMRDAIVVFPWTPGASKAPSEEEELMAAKDEIIASVNKHTDNRQSDDLIVAYEQLHRFEVDPAGNLRHQWFDPKLGKWNAETWASGCEPNARVSTIADYNGSIHVFAPAADNTKVSHAWYSPRAGRATEVIAR